MRAPIPCLAAMALVAGSPAAANIQTFGDRSAYEAAAHPNAFETFNEFRANTSFAGSPVTAGFMTFSTAGPDPIAFINKVAVPPYDDPGVDGTALIFARVGDGVSVTITFAHAVTSFGATFKEIVPTTTFFVNDAELEAPRFDPDTLLTFFGFTSDEAFSSITFSSATPNFFMIDNVSVTGPSLSAVPEPTSWALMIAGFGLAGAGLRRRRRSGLVRA